LCNIPGIESDHGFKSGRIITVWTFDIPASLEIQLARKLRKKYKWLRKGLNEDEVIFAVSEKLELTVEALFRQSVELFQDCKWFDALCKVLSEKLLK
jgi:hypothetical protein